MKKIIFILLLGLIVSGCYMDYGTAEPEIIGEITDYDFENDIPEFETYENYLWFLHENIVYKKDIENYNIEEYWQSPEETWTLKHGDCEDFCILFQYIIKKQFGLDSKLVLIKQSKTENHFIVYIPKTNQYIDPTNHCIISHVTDTFLNKIYFYLDYSKVLWMTFNFHKVPEEFSYIY